MKITTDKCATHQALDGRWNYGPASLADALRREETGTYATRGEAEAAMTSDNVRGTP